MGQAPPPSVTIAPGSSSLTVAAGGSITDTLTVTSMGGYSGTLQFSCANLPQNATCTFQPSTLTLSGTSGPQKTVVTIQTAGNAAALREGSFPPGNNALLSAAFWSPGLLTMVLAGRKRRISSRSYYVVVLLALFAGVGLVIGCGGGTPKSVAPTAPVTPAGTSTVQISATASGSTVQSFNVTLTVQ